MSELSLTQQRLAELVLVSRQAIGTWLKGDVIPHQRHMKRLAERLQVSVEWLMGHGSYHEVRSLSALGNYLGDMASIRSEVGDLSRRYEQLAEEHQDLADRYREKVRELEIEHDLRLRKAGKKFQQENALPSKNISGQDTRKRVLGTAMRSSLSVDAILKRVAIAARNAGGQRVAATELKVKPQQLNDWLSRRYVPGGEVMLRLLAWVEEKEAQQKSSPEGARTPPGQTQLRSSKHEKPKSDQPKASRKREKKAIRNAATARTASAP